MRTLEPWTPDSFFHTFERISNQRTSLKQRHWQFLGAIQSASRRLAGMAIFYHRLWTVSSGRSSVIFVVVFVNCKVRDTAKRPLGKKTFYFWELSSKKRPKAPATDFENGFCAVVLCWWVPDFYKKKCFIDVVFVFFLIKDECKLCLSQQHGIYDNGKALPQVYRERVLDLYHQESTQSQISQDMRVSIGYVNKVVQFYEQSNFCLPAPRKTPLRNIFTADIVESEKNQWHTQLKFNNVCYLIGFLSLLNYHHSLE